MTGVFIRGKKDHDTQRAREAAMRRRRQRLGAGGVVVVVATHQAGPGAAKS